MEIFFVEHVVLLFNCLLLFLPSISAFPLMYPLSFIFRNICYDTTSTHGFFVNLVESNGGNVSNICSCVSYFMTYFLPFYLNFLKPVFSAYCFMIIWSMWLSRSLSVIFSTVSSMFRWMCPLFWVLPSKAGIILVTCFLVFIG